MVSFTKVAGSLVRVIMKFGTGCILLICMVQCAGYRTLAIAPQIKKRVGGYLHGTGGYHNHK